MNTAISIESKQRANQPHPNQAIIRLRIETTTSALVASYNLLLPLTERKSQTNLVPILKAAQSEGNTVDFYLVILQAKTAQEEAQASLVMNNPIQTKHIKQSKTNIFVFIVAFYSLVFSFFYYCLASGEGRYKIEGIRATMMTAKMIYAFRPRRRIMIGAAKAPMPKQAVITRKSSSTCFPDDITLKSIRTSTRKQGIAAIQLQKPWKKGLSVHRKKKFVEAITARENAIILWQDGRQDQL